MFQDWDPEIILVIETRPTEAGPRWHFGAGKFSNRPLRLLHKDKEVWKHPTIDYGGPSDTFYVLCRFQRRNTFRRDQRIKRRQIAKSEPRSVPSP